MSACSICAALPTAPTVVLPPRTPPDVVALCPACVGALAGGPLAAGLAQHLRDAVWSEDAGVQVVAWRLLHRVGEPWAGDLLEQVWLDEDRLAWARAGLAAADEPTGDAPLRVTDANGTALAEGDAVTLIKDLEVKGAGFTAKRGTLVKGIHLTDDPGLVEGRVNGMVIVLKTAFLKRAG